MNAQAQRTEQRELKRSLLFAASGFISVAVIVALAFFLMRSVLSGAFDQTHGQDTELESVFREHPQEFSRLVNMSRADIKVMRIAYDFTWLDDNTGWPRPEAEWGVTKERWDEYRQLFRELELSDGILQDTKGGITYLIASSRGLVTNGTSKGYAYSEKELSPTVDTLDHIASWPKGQRVLYKKLKDGWYLFFWSV